MTEERGDVDAGLPLPIGAVAPVGTDVERLDDGAISGSTATDVARELALARERLAFYESFDRLIQDNIGRSGDLLRRAAEERDAASREVAAARSEVERRLRDHRQTLLGLADDVQALGRRTTDLSQRILDAVQALQAEVGADDGDGQAMPVSLQARRLAPEVTSADAASDLPLPSVSGSDADALMATGGPSEERGTGPGASTANELPHAIDVIVHGLDGSAAALDLSRYLATLPDTASVTAREFQGGTARFEVVTSGSLSPAALRDWGGSTFETLHDLPAVLELAVVGTGVQSDAIVAKGERSHAAPGGLEAVSNG